MAWLASSATKAHFHQTLTRRNNLGDVTAKATSQAITGSLVGTTAGITIGAMCGDSVETVIAVHAALSVVNMLSLYKLCSVVVLPTLNVHRGEALCAPALANLAASPAAFGQVCAC